MNSTVMRLFLKMSKILSVLAFVSLACLFTNCTQVKEKEKPNIIFLFADDQCFNTVNTLGNTEIITPNLDRLSNSGVTFTHAYNMGAWNGAVCLASRAMMNTGRTVWRAYNYEGRQKDLVDRGEMWGAINAKSLL